MKLNEVYKNLIKEEFDYANKKATVYHLTGFKTANYDRAYKEKLDKANLVKFGSEYGIDTDDIIQGLNRPDDNADRAKSILSNITSKKAKEDLLKITSKGGKAYYIANKMLKDPYSIGASFIPGGGAMYGKGLYTCYEFNPKIARTYGDIILRFEVDISNFLIFNPDIAKNIYGENWLLQDQFKQILQNKGIDYQNLNQEIKTLFDTYTESLEKISNSNILENSKRTAHICLASIKYFSSLFLNGKLLKLRDIIDGVIFYGNNDGPVCLIYRPETNPVYNLTGAGYFKDDGSHYITSKLSNLIDGVSSPDLSLIDDISRDVDYESADIEYKRTRAVIDRLESRSETLINDPKFRLGVIIREINNILYSYTSSLNAKEIMSLRINNPKNAAHLTEYLDSLSKIVKYQILEPSLVFKPIIDFINLIGPSIDIINQFELDEFIDCLDLIVNQNKTLEEVIQLKPALKIIDINNIQIDLNQKIEEITKSFKSQEYRTRVQDFANFVEHSESYTYTFPWLKRDEIYFDLSSDIDYIKRLLNESDIFEIVNQINVTLSTIDQKEARALMRIVDQSGINAIKYIDQNNIEEGVEFNLEGTSLMFCFKSGINCSESMLLDNDLFETIKNVYSSKSSLNSNEINLSYNTFDKIFNLLNITCSADDGVLDSLKVYKNIDIIKTNFIYLNDDVVKNKIIQHYTNELQTCIDKYFHHVIPESKLYAGELKI